MEESGSNFIRTIIDEHLESGRHTSIRTRFPPEPNGYLHIGHAKSICLNFGLAKDYGGACNLRFDDTNPATEDVEYVEAIQDDIRWLGFEWDGLYYASDYFEQLYEWAEELVEKGLAYVDDSTEEQIRASRGTVTEPGTPSPYRDRSVEENLRLFREMKAGKYPDGAKVLRAKIDLANPNMKMRDPLMYRIRHQRHHHRGDAWCIYPFYDWAHGQSDAIEGITHSICTLEFENNRELYDWYVERVSTPSQPRQYEFARLKLGYTMMSKRKLLQLVREGTVSGWDDPRMPTIAAFRRRGYTPESIRHFAERVGVAKANSLVDVALLENSIRDDLNDKAPRVMCVLEPLEVVVDNWEDGKVDALEASLWPHDVPKEGTRQVPFSGRLYIERDDFRENPPKKFFRLAPGREVRLRYGYLLTCTSVEKDGDDIVRLHATVDLESRGGKAADGRKVKGTIHWVDAAAAVPVEVRLYDRLFRAEVPGSETGDPLDDLNPDSLTVLTGQAEPMLRDAVAGQRFQFERTGYFHVDPVDSAEGAPVFNRIVPLKDSWAKKKPAPQAAPPKPTQDTPAKSAPTEVVRTPDHQQRFDRYTGWGLPDIEADVLSRDEAVAAWYEAAAGQGDAKAIAGWLINQVLPHVDTLDALTFGPAELVALVALVDGGTITSAAGRQVLEVLREEGGDPAAIVKARGLEQISDTGALEAMADEVIAANPGQVEKYRSNPRLFGFFVGQMMKKTGGKANPQAVQEVLRSKLDG